MSDSAQASHPGAAQLAAFVRGQLPAAERVALQAHLAGCPGCRTTIARLAKRSPEPPTQSNARPASEQATAGAADPAPPAAAPALPPDLTNHPRYEVLQLLGQGGMGAVYKARHKAMDRIVALKVINVALLGNSSTVERFQREVKAAAKLHHPNIITAHDAELAGATHFLVMEFVAGTDLARYVQQKGPLPAAYACHFIRQAALGLQHAHEHGMVHRDIKPGNLMLAAGGVVKVMDFGLARLTEQGSSGAGLTGENVVMGTADYIAPEQAADAHKADIRTDIYSLGCALYHLLAGRPPFGGNSVMEKITRHALAEPPLAELAVPDGLRTVLAKMLAKDPAQRYQTPLEVAQALVPFIKKRSTVEAPAPGTLVGERAVGQAFLPASPEAGRNACPTARRRWWLAGALAAVLLAAGFALWLLRPSGHRLTPPPAEDGSTVAKQPEVLPATFTNGLGMEFVLVPRGKFLMGGSGGKPGTREVVIGEDFYLGKYEVTQEEWAKVMGSNPSYFSPARAGKDRLKDLPEAQRKRLPVENVSWDDAQQFLALLNQRAKEGEWLYRLPAEAEWEYACRGGPPSTNPSDGAADFYCATSTNQLLPAQANCKHEKPLDRPCPVGSYPPNRLGLHDMHGNVAEWCHDSQASQNGVWQRANRGGSWSVGSGLCRATSRTTEAPSQGHYTLGLRVARVPALRKGKYTNSLGMEFVLVPKGKSWLGGGGGRVGMKEVVIPRDFYLGRYEVTQEEWRLVMGNNPSTFKAGNKDVAGIPKEELERFPVETVSWEDAQAFVAKVNGLERQAGWEYRLPTELEWEYACRGGPLDDRADSAYDFYLTNPLNQLLPQQANFVDSGLKRTCKVGSYPANRLGLYDMHGNVWEWCLDEAPPDPKDPKRASQRVDRGGSWSNDSGNCRAAYRYTDPPSSRSLNRGLRLARVPVGMDGK